VIRCGVEQKKKEVEKEWKVECYKCGEEGHKCRECLLWERKERVVHVARLQKAHQQERRPACPIEEKAQEGEKRLM